MIKDIDILAREWADPHVANDEELARLLGPDVGWERVVVLGDSIAAGVREPSPGYRDLSWVDRLAAGLAFARPGAVVHNLGRRDLTAAEVREAQLEEALALGPDLAIVAVGGNDLLRREFDPNLVCDELSAILGPLRAAGADVVTFGLLDNTATGLVPERFVTVLRERLVELADVTRAVSMAVGGWHVSLREHPAAGDVDIFASDGLHLNARGHAIVGTALARHLGAARVGAKAAVCCPRWWLAWRTHSAQRALLSGFAAWSDGIEGWKPAWLVALSVFRVTVRGTGGRFATLLVRSGSSGVPNTGFQSDPD